MTTAFFDRHAARLSVGSAASGSRRHSLLSSDGAAASPWEPAYSASAQSAGGASGWRQSYVASDTGDATGIQSTSLALPDDTRFTTCLALSDDQPLLAVGSGSHETNMFFVQTLDDQLDVKASFASKFPIYALAFKANLLMAGTDRNTCVLYHVDRARLLGFGAADGAGAAADDGPLVRCVGTYKNKSARSIDVAAPGSHVATRRVSCVEFAPPFAGSSSGGGGGAWPPAGVSSTADVFLACLGGVVNVWDAAATSSGGSQHALRVEKVSAQPVARAAWSPLAPGTLVAAGGGDGVVSVLDLRRRGKALAWRTAGGWAGDGVADVAWSPHVPYWLATAGGGEAASLWDLRYVGAAPAATLASAAGCGTGAVGSLAWSATHVDLLATGASDRFWRLHALRAADDGAGPGAGPVGSAVVGVRRAADDVGGVVGVRAKGSTFFSLSACGDLYAHRLTGAALAGAAVHRPAAVAAAPPAQRAQLAQAEERVYARDIRGAAEAVLAQPAAAGAEAVRALCDLFKAKPRPPPAAWALPPLPPGADEPAAPAEAAAAARAALAADLAYYGYGLPPDFPLEATAARVPAVWQALERLNGASLRARLEALVAQAEQAGGGGAAAAADGRPLWRAVVDRQAQIVQSVRGDAPLDARLLRAAVKMVLPHDCIAGLTLGLAVCDAYLANHNASPVPLPGERACAALDGLVHVLLFPTVFDEGDLPPADAADAAGGASAAAAVRPAPAPDVAAVRARIAECLAACPAAVVAMVRLEIRVQEAVLRGGEQAHVAERIVAAMQAHAAHVATLLLPPPAGSSPAAPRLQIHPAYPATTTLSASAVRLYLNALVPMRAYDDYLANAQWWRAPPVVVAAAAAAEKGGGAGDAGSPVGRDYAWLSSYPLARTLARQASTLVEPRFRRQLDVVSSTIRSEPLTLEPRLYRDTLLKIARLTLLTRCIPASSSSAAADTLPAKLLAESFDEIAHAFLMLLEALTRHTSHRDAYKRAAAEASPLADALRALVADERERRPHRNDARNTNDIDALCYDQRKAHINVVTRYLRSLDKYANPLGDPAAP
ncbi:hypothetical protein LPJ53_005135 [Coemansia erecta]|uniref:WD40 repeat-like protein n=1 Tax=Coemansia erecta TaxID=147472 RepID=A0A9W7XX02_9FUNG|nr:hypothetical protein LPJ53_005135 [Coemansia erecta]